ncbi:hypothetical protein AB1Y20_015730 [Prymnesium parvum]|uniref:Uncharacterized protein n=1 Tax=Prymnesium parvum TaxID=97485 RepID=A0AB34JZB5_PRYPA
MSCTGALAPGNDSRPRVAVCIVGFARTFAERGVYTTIEHAFRPVGSRVDFYGVVSLGGGTEHDTAKGQWKAVPALALRPALELLRPVAWEDNMPMRQGPPPCNLACMRQYERLEQCGTLVRRVETLCNLSYTTVVKTRPDIAFFGQNQPHVRNDTVYKDTAAGDMVVYIPRWSFDELTRLLSSNLVGTVEMDWVHAGRLVSLRKPGDINDQDDATRAAERNIRPIGLVSIFMRLIGSVAAKQFAGLFAANFDPEDWEGTVEMDWVHAGRLVSLRKPGNIDDQDDATRAAERNIRPIGLVSIFMRLIGSVAAKQFAGLFAANFDPEDWE